MEQWGTFSTTRGMVVAMETNQNDGSRDQSLPTIFSSQGVDRSTVVANGEPENTVSCPGGWGGREERRFLASASKAGS